jgi:transcription elongation GreA/GreB family factor
MSTNIKFSERGNDQTIEFDGTASEVCQGCLVNLEHEGTTITAKVIECTDGQDWIGEITDSQDDAVKIGSTVEFEEDNIFRCAA